jgi:hypothetical protein
MIPREPDAALLSLVPEVPDEPGKPRFEAPWCLHCGRFMVRCQCREPLVAWNLGVVDTRT